MMPFSEWAHSPSSAHRLRRGEFPCAVEDFGTRAKEARRVVPVPRDRQAIGNFAVQPPNWIEHLLIVDYLSVSSFGTDV
jgi:hypothetical protein